MAPAALDAAKLNLRSKTAYFSSINTFNQPTPPIKYKISIKYKKLIAKFKTIKLQIKV